MRNSKGITIITLIGYVILSIMVISVLVAITGNFKKNFNELDVQTTQEVEFDKINLQISKEIKDGNEVNKTQTTEKELVFKDGTTYKYVQEDNAIYLNNNIKIAEHITNCKFEIINDKILRVTAEIKDEKRVMEYAITAFTDRSYLKIGDYVDYTPDVAENYMGLGTSESEKAGSTSNPATGILQDTTLKWRIMSINDDGSVEIVSANPTNQLIYFNNPIGFNNGVYLLNDLCAKLYSNSELEVTARSINLLDIEDKMNSVGIAARNAYDSGIKTYGDSQNYTEESAYIPDIYMHVGKTTEEESKDYYTLPTTKTYTQESGVTVQQTFYSFSNTPTNYFDNPIFHEMIFGTNTSYWLASRFASCNADYAEYARFGLRYVYENNLLGSGSFRSYLHPDGSRDYCFVRPVVSLGSNIQISFEGGTADNPRTLSK